MSLKTNVPSQSLSIYPINRTTKLYVVTLLLSSIVNSLLKPLVTYIEFKISNQKVVKPFTILKLNIYLLKMNNEDKYLKVF